LNGRCDSFVVETDVHYPTDINLLFDAMRKTIEVCAQFCDEQDLTDWRQSAYNIRKLKKLYRRAQRIKHSTSKDEAKREARREEVKEAYRVYLEQAEAYLRRARETRMMLVIGCGVLPALLAELDAYIAHAERQIDQIRRRVILGQMIPHEEKVFSIFEPHTEWISKGKAGVPVELGLRVCVFEDQHRFILHHQVMEKISDEQIAVEMVEEARKRFPQLVSVSMDKGFHSPANQRDLRERLDCVVVPKKGKLSAAEKVREGDPEFIRLRHRHSAVESAINALEVHGLDRCPDHGIRGFKRYVALAVVARNIQRIGAILYEQEREREQRKRGPYKKAA
jgi:hypothetical protein